MTTPSPPEVKPLKLETELQDQDLAVTSRRAKKSIAGEVPGRVSGFCSESLLPVGLSSVYSQQGSEKGNDWFAAATDCSSVSAE